jgi:microcompartment protein CcmL/EutN
MMRTIARYAAALTGALLLAATPVAGQAVGADTAVQGYAPGEVSASGEAGKDRANPMKVVGSVVLAPRSDAYLEQAIEAADRALNRADAELASAAGRRKQAEELVRQRELRLSQIEVAKGQKAEALSKPRRDSLEAEEQGLKRRLPLTKDAVALANIEMDVAGAAREAAIAEQQALESERMLVRKRAESDGDTESVLSLARETLLAQKKSAGLAERLASKRALLASKRLDLYRAYLDMRKREGS